MSKKKAPAPIMQPGAPRSPTSVNGDDKIVMGELSPKQKMLLIDCVDRMKGVAKQYEMLKAEYQRLVAMVIPDGANGLDLEAGYFYYQKPSLPTPPLEGNDDSGDSPADEAADDEAAD